MILKTLVKNPIHFIFLLRVFISISSRKQTFFLVFLFTKLSTDAAATPGKPLKFIIACANCWVNWSPDALRNYRKLTKTAFYLLLLSFVFQSALAGLKV
jgi:hypothetical protein